MDVVALGELLIDFTTVKKDDSGYPTMAAHPGGAGPRKSEWLLWGEEEQRNSRVLTFSGQNGLCYACSDDLPGIACLQDK